VAHANVDLEWYGWPNRPCDTKCSDDCRGRRGCQIFGAWFNRYCHEFGDAAAAHYEYPHDPDRNARVTREAQRQAKLAAAREKRRRLNEAIETIAETDAAILFRSRRLGCYLIVVKPVQDVAFVQDRFERFVSAYIRS